MKSPISLFSSFLIILGRAIETFLYYSLASLHLCTHYMTKWWLVWSWTLALPIMAGESLLFAFIYTLGTVLFTFMIDLEENSFEEEFIGLNGPPPVE